MSNKPDEILKQVFSDSVADLFEFYSGSRPTLEPVDNLESIRLVPDSGDESGKMASSAIGIGNDDFRCSLCLMTYTETLEKLYQGDLDSPTDWIGEVTNQMLGRIKNGLVSYGANTQMTIPVSIEGHDLRFPVQSGNQQIIVIQSEFGNWVSLLNYEVFSDLEWEYCEEEECAEEGSLCLF